MKKFTFMLIAAFVAVASWAGVPVKKSTALQAQNVVQMDAQKKAPKLIKAAAPFMVTAPVTNRLSSKAKANVRKAPKKASIADKLTGDLMLVSDYYDVDFTFNFNKMDVATSSNNSHDGDIEEDLTIKEGSVSLTISPSTTSTPNRFWSTSGGPQLRVYGGTLTFEVPEGSTITQIVFNHNGKWGENTADTGKIENDDEAKAATWTGEAQTVVVTIAANSQINSIVVTVVGGGAQPVDDNTLVELPAGVEPVEYTLVLSGATSQTTISEKNSKYVAFDGNDVYLQGLAYYFDEAYVKGTINDNGQIIVKSGQFVGEDEYGVEYIVGASLDEEDNFVYEPEIVFDYDKNSGVISLVEGTYYGESESSNDVSLWDYFYSAVYTPGAFVKPEGVVAPEDLVTETYQFKGFDTYNMSDDYREVQVGFYGDNQVYIQGLSYFVEDAWVVGTLEGNTLTIPETNLGVFKSFFGDYDLTFSGATFTYDPEKDTFTAVDDYIGDNVQSFVSYETPEDPYWMDEYSNVVLRKVFDVAATPANPEITKFDIEASYPSVSFNIPLEDVDGNGLLMDKLSYQLFVDNESTPLVLTTDIYEGLTEDMSEIPYTFSDDWDVYNNQIYLNQGVDVLSTWKKIGIQSIYYGGGETNKSDIVWFVLETTGITGVSADDKNVMYFDLQGRRVAQPGKGLYIANGKKVVIK